MTWKERRWRVMILSAILLLPGGCASGSRGSFCDIYRPVYSRLRDTELTKKQIDENNAAWIALCS